MFTVNLLMAVAGLVWVLGRLVEDLGVVESDGADRRHRAILDLAAWETEFPDRLERVHTPACHSLRR